LHCSIRFDHRFRVLTMLKYDYKRHKGVYKMLVPTLLTGMVLGFGIAAPVGPIGVLVIRRTLAAGRGSGFVAGLGAATADAVYGLIGAWGLTAVSTLLLRSETWLRLIGGIFLCYMGVRTMVATPAEPVAAGRSGHWSAYGSMFLLTLTNPITILSFTAMFAGLGVGTTGSYSTASALVAGVFLGSCAWWLLLSSGVSVLRMHLTMSAVRWINIVSGIIVLGFGVVALVGLR